MSLIQLNPKLHGMIFALKQNEIRHQNPPQLANLALSKEETLAVQQTFSGPTSSVRSELNVVNGQWW
ncbi:hypothetical protein HQN90_34240 [Paenibacillus alba]|uniref:hypothetical protein n=1 Tax=Paenibacillus alba TaxID=1197127 RepID=UPI001566FE72|nr:hypothetical protein [Paenibacillus alba]NQX71194.1 hypothetical protein [Paenibacillus alba]